MRENSVSRADPNSTILTPEEAAVFLRLDKLGSKNPLETLRYYRNHKGLKAVRYGKKCLYMREELERFARESSMTGPEVGESA